MENWTRVITSQLIIIFMLIYFCFDSLVTTVIINYQVSFLSLSLFILIAFVTSVFRGQCKINRTLFFLCLIEIVIIFMNMLYNSDFHVLNFVIITNILIALCICSIMTFEEFSENVIKVMLILCVFSLLITYLFRPTIEASGLFPVYFNSSNISFIFAGFSFISESENLRNTGIFREMGVYQFFITIPLIFELFFVKRTPKILNCIIFSITIITTFSTAGILQLFMMLNIYIIKLGRIEKKHIKTALILISCIVMIAFICLNYLPEVFTAYQQSMTKIDDLDNDSYLSRYYSIPSNILTWAEKPILGHGITKGYQASFDTLVGQYSMHNTSTTTIFLLLYGALFCLISTFPLFILVAKIKSNIIVKLLVFIVILVSMNTQALEYDQFVMVFLFCAYMRSEETFAQVSASTGSTFYNKE